MPDDLRLYLDQCLRIEVSQALKGEGHDVVRASEVGQAHCMIRQGRQDCAGYYKQKTKIDYVIRIRKNMSRESSHIALFTRKGVL